MVRPFRFALTIGHVRNRADLVETVKRAEEAGFHIAAGVDHVASPLSVFPLLAVAAEVSTLRVATMVVANDYRNPVLLAQEAATLDILSGGRLELGIGTGWIEHHYRAAGIPFEPAGIRVDRLAEALTVVKGTWKDPHFHFDGRHYRAELDGSPPPLQTPRPPILVGGSGPRMLKLAAAEADIVGVTTTYGHSTFDAFGRAVATSADHIASQIEWIRSSAGDRFPDLELSTMIHGFTPGPDVAEAAEAHALATGVTEDEVLTSPHVLVGPPGHMAEALIERRERYGLSHIVFRGPQLEQAAAVVRRLSGR